jgi:hypothetical protein
MDLAYLMHINAAGARSLTTLFKQTPIPVQYHRVLTADRLFFEAQLIPALQATTMGRGHNDPSGVRHRNPSSAEGTNRFGLGIHYTKLGLR